MPRRPLRALHKAGLFIHFQVLLLCSQIRSLSYGRCLAIKSISPMGFGTRPLWVFLDELNPRIEVVLRKAARRSFALSPSGAYLLRLLASRSFFVRRRAGALPSALAARTFFAFFIVVQFRRLQRGNSKTANSDSKRTSAPKAERTAALQSIQCGFHSELEASVEKDCSGTTPSLLHDCSALWVNVPRRTLYQFRWSLGKRWGHQTTWPWHQSRKQLGHQSLKEWRNAQ